MQISRCTNTDQWESISREWNALTRGNPFASWEWLSNWWRHYGKGRELCVLTARDEQGTLRGATPWYAERCATKGCVIRTLGSGEVCSEYISVLCTPSDEELVADVVSRWLTEDCHQR